jgi:hypothetical protein
MTYHLEKPAAKSFIDRFLKSQKFLQMIQILQKLGRLQITLFQLHTCAILNSYYFSTWKIYLNSSQQLKNQRPDSFHGHFSCQIICPFVYTLYDNIICKIDGSRKTTHLIFIEDFTDMQLLNVDCWRSGE